MPKFEYVKGSSVWVKASFTDPDQNDEPVDPNSVALTISPPAGADVDVDSGDIENTSTGEYRYTLLLDQSGTYRWKYTGTIGSRVVVLTGLCDSRLRIEQ